MYHNWHIVIDLQNHIQSCLVVTGRGRLGIADFGRSCRVGMRVDVGFRNKYGVGKVLRQCAQELCKIGSDAFEAKRAPGRVKESL